MDRNDTDFRTLSGKGLQNHVGFLGAVMVSDLKYVLLQICLITTVSAFQVSLGSRRYYNCNNGVTFQVFCQGNFIGGGILVAQRGKLKMK